MTPRAVGASFVKKKVECAGSLDGLGCRCARGRRRGPGKGIPAGFLFWTLVDLDGAFEVGAVFDHDPGSSQVTVDRTIFFDFYSILRAKVSLHVAIHHHLAGNDVSGHFRGGPHSQPPLIELNQSFDRAIDQQIFVAGDLTFHVQADPEPRRGAVRGCTQWTHRICTHRGFILPSRRSVLLRLIRLYVSCIRLPGLRCIRFLISPHRTSPRASTIPRRFPAGVLQTVFLGRARSKQSVKLLFQTVTRLRDRACQGRWAVHENTEGIRVKCKADSFSIFVDCPSALARPVLKSSYCLEQQLHTLFAARTAEEYSLQYPGRKSAWRGAVPWEVRCGAIRNRMHRKPGNRMQETYKRIRRRSPLRRLGRINPQ